jgi:hypothetical protein
MNFTESVEHIRTTFFPRWDRKRHWQVVQVDDLNGAQGWCERESKTISILDGMIGNDLLALLIHEIAHAASNDCHGRRWLNKMEEAANDANRLGQAALASLLREQIAGYQDDFRVTAAMLYNEIENCVFEQPYISFSQVVDFLRRDYGLSQDDFLRRFRRAERVFDVAKRDARDMAERKAAWLREQGVVLNTSA